MPIFRVNKTKDYTVMGNFHLKDKLTLKAKGLLSLILSLPEDWDYSVEGLTQICLEGKDAVASAIRELEKANYITRETYRNDKGQFEVIYSIYEQPRRVSRDGLAETENPLRHNNKILNINRKVRTTESLEQESSLNISSSLKEQEVVAENTEIKDLNDDRSGEPSLTATDKRKYILDLFEKTWVLYPHKVGKEQAKKTWIKKLDSLKTLDDITNKARKIVLLLNNHIKSWASEVDKLGNKGRPKQYIPHFSTWLNSEVPDKEDKKL